jgi:hypothetical protein
LARRQRSSAKKQRFRSLLVENLEQRTLLATIPAVDGRDLSGNPQTEVSFEAAMREGSTGLDIGAAVAADAAGNVYFAGIVEGVAVAAKYTSAGAPVWVRSFVGWFGTEGADIAVDSAGNVYLTGSFRGTVDFNPGPGTFNLSSPNTDSAFVLKLDSAGNFLWARRQGGSTTSDRVESNGIVVDAAGNVFTTGSLQGTADFDLSTAAGSLTSAGGRDVFVAKLDTAGNYGWAVRAGSTGDDRGQDIARDSAGNVYVTGKFLGTADFDPGSGTSNLTSNGSDDVFLWKLGTGGNLLGAQAIGGGPSETAGGIAIDAADGVYLTGSFWGDSDFDPGAGVCHLVSAGGSDVFVLRFNADLTLAWGVRMGGPFNDPVDVGTDLGVSIAADSAGSVFVTGTFRETSDFDPGSQTANLTSAGLKDVFVVRLHDGTGAFAWAGRLGGSGQDQARAIAADGAGNLYTTGNFEGTADFDPGPESYNLTSAGSGDVFVSHLTYNTNAPRVTIDQAADQADPTNEHEIDFTVVFSVPVTGFATGDVTLTSSTAPGTLVGTVTPVGTDGQTYHVTVTGMTGSGTVIATVAAGVAVDAEGRANRASTSTDNAVLYDSVGPTAAPADPANGSSASYVVLNSRQYIDITFADTGGSGVDPATISDDGLEFTLGGGGASGVTVLGAGQLVSGTTYRYQFTGTFGIGPVSVDFLAGSFFDLAGNPNAASHGGFSAVEMPVLGIVAPAVNEGNTGTVNAVLTVNLSYASDQPVTVQYTTGDGTATAGKDYTAKSGTLTFPVGTLSQTVTVAVLGDVLDEYDETFHLTLFNATNAQVPAAPGEAWIIDDDAPVQVSIKDASVTEGNVGTTNMLFEVSLSAVSGKQIQLCGVTYDGTAQNGSDYQPDAGCLVFLPGEVKKPLTVAVIGDLRDEPNESFELRLQGVSVATVLDGTAVGTIIDDDPTPTLSIEDVTLDEAGGDAVFTVSLSAESGQTVTVQYATANGTATAPADYTATAGTLTFDPGTTAQTIHVPIIDDAILELSESFQVKLLSPVGATLGRGTATGTILDNEPKPTISIADRASSEATAMVFTISLSAPSALPVSVQYATVAGTATAGKDYKAVSKTLTLSPGTLSKTISISITNDKLDEYDETFQVVLSNPSGANPGVMTATGTILDDDPPPAISIKDAKVKEGDVGQVNAVFNLKLSAASGKPITVAYTTVDGTATAGSDYQAMSGNVDFALGETQKTLLVPVFGDTLDEVNETFVVKLSDPVNATLADDSGLGTITDNDAAPTLSINDVAVDEAAGNAVFTVTLSPVSGQQVTVQYATANGSAAAPGDYAATTGSLVFPAGTPSQTIGVPIVDDDILELSETFKVNLTGATAAKIVRKSGTGTILDNEPKPTISIADQSSSEATAMLFTVSLSAPSPLPVSVQWTTVPGSATSGVDYQVAGGTLSFPTNTTTKTLSISIINDQLTEPDETFQILLSNPSGANPGNMLATGTILDDDAPGITVTPTAGLVTTESAGKATFKVKLNTQPTANVTVSLASSDTSEGTVSPAALTFTPSNWNTTQTVTVTGVDDFDIDGDILYRIDVTAITTVDPTYAHLDPPWPTVSVTNRDNDTLGPGKIAVKVLGTSGYYLTDNKTPKRIDTRQGKNIGQYTQNDFPILEAFTPTGGMAYPDWICVPDFAYCHYGFNSLVMTGPEYANGLQVTAVFSGLQADAAFVGPLPSITPEDRQRTSVDETVIPSLVSQAVDAWAAAGWPEQQLSALRNVQVRFLDMPSRLLGAADGNAILLDTNAAGYGWFVDHTPWGNEEFYRTTAGPLRATGTSPAAGQMDILTVLTHELGHLLGLDDLEADDRDDIMVGTLASGVRRVPWATAVDAAFACP